MKTNILFSLLILVSVCSSAQTTTRSTQKKTGNEWHAAGDAIPRSKEFADRLTKELGLDAATAKKIHDTFLLNTKSIDEIKMDSGSEAQKRELLKSNKEAFNELLKLILTSAQFNKYLKMPEEKM